nr:tetratricopeptide repeat protein 9A-like [Cherax quadricarinatus]
MAASDFAFRMSEENVLEKLVKAKEFKQNGNNHFKQKEVKKAIQNYHRGLMYVKGMNQDINPTKLLSKRQSTPVVSQEVRDEIAALSADLHNNIAVIDLDILKITDMAVRKLMASVDQELKKENKKFNDMFKNSLLVKET